MNIEKKNKDPQTYRDCIIVIKLFTARNNKRAHKQNTYSGRERERERNSTSSRLNNKKKTRKNK